MGFKIPYDTGIFGKLSFVEAVLWQVCQYPIYILTSPSGIQLIISASPNVEITSPGRRARGFFNPCIPQGLTVIFSHHQVCVKRRREDTVFAAKVKVEFRHLFSLQKRFSLSSSHKIDADIVVFCWLTHRDLLRFFFP